MISERQQDANCRNAAKSHSPKTPAGRAAVRHNALKYGFTAAEIVLPTVEEQIDFEQLAPPSKPNASPSTPQRKSYWKTSSSPAGDSTAFARWNPASSPYAGKS